jgi:malate dehydrogenase (oxaloacetate-decarboxylating)
VTDDLETSPESIRMADHPDEFGNAALHQHALYRGKIQVFPKVPVRSLTDLATWYTPGVAAVSRAIAADPATSFEYTNRANTVAIVSDGTRVLGLGDIGPEAALPVMEGKALLFRHFGGVDAIPICLATKDAAEIVHIVEALAPTFGAINLEDIAQPKCFRILDALRTRLSIPVWQVKSDPCWINGLGLERRLAPPKRFARHERDQARHAGLAADVARTR